MGFSWDVVYRSQILQHALFLLATMYQMTAERRRTQVVINNLYKLVTKLSDCLEENFQLSAQQKVCKLNVYLLTSHL